VVRTGDRRRSRHAPSKTALAFALALAATAATALDVQGHRGARGLAPENTLAAFRTAIDLGVDTLELDLQVTRDGVLVVSHNARLSPDLTRDPSGRWLAQEGPRIHDLTLAELSAYDVGRVDPASAYARPLPAQRASDGERIPALAAVFALGRTRPDLRFNIETKLAPDAPADAPPPDAFAAQVVAAVREANLTARVTVQSFDWRTLVAVKRLAPELRTSCLTIETASTNNVAAKDGRGSAWTAGFDLRTFEGSVPRLVRAAGCDAWSPFYRNATPARIEEAHALGLTVLPWTVNDVADMQRLIDLRVDGIITDYPDRLLRLPGVR